MRWTTGGVIGWALGSFAVGIGFSLFAANLGPGERKLERPIERRYGTSEPSFRRAMGVLLGPPLLEGNKVEALQNGDRIFEAMLAAIRSARTSVTFETYIYWDGSIGQEFAAALAERARAGVAVHVLLDWIGSNRLGAEEVARMRSAGVEIERFHEPHWSHLARLNNRTHRKLLVVDGTVGFTGGVGIADKWRGDAQDAEHWRDSHYRLEGPTVAQMQAVFADNWTKSTNRVLHGERYFPSLAAVPGGATTAQVFSSSPSGGAESMHLMYLLAITAAESSIDIESSYFVPDELTIRALVAAAGRGVRVRIVVPGPIIDSDVVRRASRGLWGPLLQAGIVVAEYQPTMFHCKLVVVDGRFVSVGSTNFDVRSFRLNDEANLNVLDERFAAEQTAVFEADLARSRTVTLEAWLARPLTERVAERLAILLRDQI